MKILLIILLTIVGIIALLLILALFMKKEHYVKCEITINAPRQKVFDYIKLLKNQDYFNKNAMAGSDRIREYKGTDGTEGFIYAWSGNKDAGQGEKEIKKLIEGQRMEAEIRFIKPMKTSSYIIMELESIADNQTKVSWSNAGTLNYPVNIMIPMMEKMLPKDMDISLTNLKNILEN
ncbi:MAG: SRPBCC family protein [Saprospiraceae bacterium]|nr:SRPBCC family protein [Saprospiraceae bacterium]MBK7912177.1 SRPBCC family protein [Saprospiraceae bacterium]